VTLDDGVATVTTMADLSRNVTTRVYDIRDLIMPIMDFAPGPNEAQPTTRPTRDENLKAIQQLIVNTIDADNWAENGDITPNRMREISGQLIVTAMPQTHKELTALLEQLRECRAVQITLQARFVSVDPDQLPAAVSKQLRQTFARDRANETQDGAAHPRADDRSDPPCRQAQRHYPDYRPADHLVQRPARVRQYFDVARLRRRLQRHQIRCARTTLRAVDPDGNSGLQLEASATASADRKNVTVSIKPRSPG